MSTYNEMKKKAESDQNRIELRSEKVRNMIGGYIRAAGFDCLVCIVSRWLELADEVDELLQEGLIQRFGYTHELVWKVMKDYAEYQGYTDIRGSRDAIRKALQIGLIEDKRWMETIEDRNLTSHNYDDDVASEIYENIVQVYYPLFCRFKEKMLCISENETR